MREMGFALCVKGFALHAVLVSSGRELQIPEMVAKTVLSPPHSKSALKLSVFLTRA